MIYHQNDIKLKMKDRENQLFSFIEIGRILGASLEGAPGILQSFISGISIDSRTTKEGDLFVAILGDKFDGHKFIADAFKKGAMAAVVNKPFSDSSVDEDKLIRVDDTVYALGELAKKYNENMTAEIIAVTGSNGKTTVKNLIYHIISEFEASLKSKGNFNNFYGLPLSLFELTNSHKYGVFELGMSASGEIRRLSEIASPYIAVITNVGPAHLEFFNSIDDIAKAKLEIIENIRPDGILIVNGDDEYLMNCLADYKGQMITFGYTDTSDIYPTDLVFDDNQIASFKINDIDIKSPLAGKHNVYNVLASVAVSNALKLDMSLVAERISNYIPEGMRTEIVEKSGIKLILDCYNANPVSMKFALDTLGGIECDGKRIAVIGDMLELGGKSVEYHYEIGAYAKQLNIDYLLGYGPLSENTISDFGENGFYFTDKDSLSQKLIEYVHKGDIVLFKGSRGMALEEIVNKLKEAI